MKRVLFIIPFESVYPPMNGGMLRCFNLLNQLCRYFDVTALMHQDVNSFMEASIAFPSITNCNVLSTKNNKKKLTLFSILPDKFNKAIRYRLWNRSVKGPADSNFLLLYPQMKTYLKSNKVDFVILEDMSIVNLSKLVNRYQPDIPVIYDAYNVNTILAKAVLEKGEINLKNFELTRKAEIGLFNYVDKIFACSENDLIQLCQMNKHKISGVVVPNGVVIPNEKSKKGDLKKAPSNYILFCGSMDYYPNQEGLKWFLEYILPLILKIIPDIKVHIVGKGHPGNELEILMQHASIINHGMVESVSKYYELASVAIIPLLSGSGTRLKLLEAMAYRVPVVSTATGAEGIDYSNNDSIKIADDPTQFANAVIALLHDPQLAGEIAEKAFTLVKKQYDWDIIGERLSASIYQWQTNY